jgi:uncharacterized protein (DUF2236 family)
VQATLVRGLGDVVRAFPRPAPGREGDPGLFGPGSVAWRINAESVLLLGGGRALLMQAAHPLVAAGVADHSDFTAGPLGALLPRDAPDGNRVQAERRMSGLLL